MGITHVGIDAHKEKHVVAMLLPGEKEAEVWETANRGEAVRRMVKKVLKQSPGGAVFCYEAGPCGYALQRWIEKAGGECRVVAPSLIPVKPGERVKTDRRDARKLVKLLRAGMLTEVRPPTPEEEAVRDLSRCREDAMEDVRRSRQRLGHLLLRRGRVYGQGQAWTQRHRRWLRGLRFEIRETQETFDAYLLAVEEGEVRLAALDRRLEEVAEREPWREPVGWLRCFHGIDTVAALCLVSELYGFLRFRTAAGLMAYAGLTPSEDSSGERRRRGGITKAGNVHARRMLIQIGWHYRHSLRVPGKTLQKRREGQPAWVLAHAEKARRRLHDRFWHMTLQGKEPKKAVTAVARELLGFLWAVLYTGAERAARQSDAA